MARAETFLDETGGNAAPFTEQTEKLKLEGRGNEVRFICFERNRVIEHINIPITP